MQRTRAARLTGVTGSQAERGRFELPLPFRADRFSKPAHSTTLPPLRGRCRRLVDGGRLFKRTWPPDGWGVYFGVGSVAGAVLNAVSRWRSSWTSVSRGGAESRGSFRLSRSNVPTRSAMI